jgi:hypothetical protein
MPSKLLAKEAFPSTTNVVEPDVCKKVSGKMGNPTVWGYFLLDGNGWIFRDGTTSIRWNILGETTFDFRNSRTRCVIFYETEGVQLKEAKTMRELFEAIFHAMLGAYHNLLHVSILLRLPCPPFQGHYVQWEEGYVHRDVSDNNIMLLRVPEERPPIQR